MSWNLFGFFFSYLRNCAPQIFLIETLELEMKPHGHIDGATAEMPINYLMAHNIAHSGSINHTIFSPTNAKRLKWDTFIVKQRNVRHWNQKFCSCFLAPSLNVISRWNVIQDWKWNNLTVFGSKAWNMQKCRLKNVEPTWQQDSAAILGSFFRGSIIEVQLSWAKSQWY